MMHWKLKYVDATRSEDVAEHGGEVLGLGGSGGNTADTMHPDHGYSTLDAAISGWQHMSTAWVG
jgi:hypothetical protein